MDKLIPFCDKLRKILKEKGISTLKFEYDTGIGRRIFYETNRKHGKSLLMGIAYYLNMTVEELVKGTDAEDVWYY
jgi:hypothetical protein